MEWLGQLENQVIGLDTAPLIYFMEQNSTYLEVVRAFFQAMSRGDFHVVTSTLTLTEVLVHPIRAGNVGLAEEYREILFDQENLITLSVTSDIAELAAHLRANQNLRIPDAIQIATAIQAQAKFFFTNDMRLAGAEGINILVLDDLIAE